MRSQPPIVPITILSLLLLWASSSSMTFAQGSHCDPGLNVVTDGPYGYRPRGDRCEGIYIRAVQVSSLKLVSLTESVEDFNPATNQNLLVQWAAPAKTNVRLRAYGLRHRHYYRMDTLRPVDSTSYSWSPNLLAALGLKKHEVGLVAWVSHQVGTQHRDVYLPIRLSQRTAASKSNRYDLMILPGVELTEVYVSLATVQPDGSTGIYIKRNEPLGWGYYPAERGITFATPELKEPGIYYLEIGATRKVGGSTTTRVWFYRHQ